MATQTPTPEQRHRQSAIDRLSQIVELAAQGRAALAEGADAAETAALLESLKYDVKSVLDDLERAAREAAPKFKVGGEVEALSNVYGLTRGQRYQVTFVSDDVVELSGPGIAYPRRVPTPHLFLAPR